MQSNNEATINPVEAGGVTSVNGNGSGQRIDEGLGQGNDEGSETKPVGSDGESNNDGGGDSYGPTEDTLSNE